MQVWITNDSMDNAGALGAALEQAAKARSNQELKAFVIFVEKGSEAAPEIGAKLQELSKTEGLRRVALLTVPAGGDAVSEYHISTDSSIKNTVLVYKDKTVKCAFVNLTADKAGIQKLNKAVEQMVKAGG